MCQIETPLRSVEEGRETLSNGSASLKNQAHETFETVSVESKVPLSEAGGLLDGMSNDVLLAVLGSIALLIIVAVWFFDDVYERIDSELYRLKYWWRCKRESRHLPSETPVISSKLGLSSTLDTDQSAQPLSTLEEVASEVVERVDTLPTQPQSEFKSQTLADELARAREAEHQLRSESADAKEQLKLLVEVETQKQASKDSRIETLEESVEDHLAQIELLQASLAEKSSETDRMNASLEDSEQRCQKLTDELASLTRVDEKSRYNLANATAEIETLTLQAIRFENDTRAATQEALEKATLADRLHDENLKLKTSLEHLEDQFAGAEAEAEDLLRLKEDSDARLQKEIDNRTRAAKKFDLEISERESQLVASQKEVFSLKSEAVELAKRVTQNEMLELSLSETSANVAQMTTALEESDLRCQKLTDEVTALSCVDEQLRSELANAKIKIESVTSQAIQFENDLKTATQKAYDKTKQEDRLLDENTTLKASLEKLEDRFAIADAEVKDLSKSKEDIQAQLRKEIDIQARAKKEFESEIAERESQLVISQAEISRLKSEIDTMGEDAQRKLDEASSKFSSERTLHNQFKVTATRAREELTLQASKFAEQESRLESFKARAEKSDHELAATVALLASERLSLAEITENAQKREEELNQLISRNSELQSSRETSQKRAEQAEEELAETLKTLKNEQDLRASTLQKLEASTKLVEELEQEADAPTVTVADYHLVLRKLNKYKKAVQKLKVLVDELVVQKAEMSDLASEYVAMAKTIKHELDEERQTNCELKSKLNEVNVSAVDFNEQEIKSLVDQRARTLVLDLKSQFEEKLNQKNELIREIQKRQVAESSAL